MFDLDALKAAGFKKQLSKKEWEERNAEYAASPRSAGGPYVVDYVLKKGDVSIVVERNTATSDGLKVEFPAVALVQGPSGTVAVSASDTQLILAMVDEVG